jgi:hypothetical protein
MDLGVSYIEVDARTFVLVNDHADSSSVWYVKSPRTENPQVQTKPTPDVQMTRDHVPIIYHDFLLSESGADLAPHHLSFDQVRPIFSILQHRQPL